MALKPAGLRRFFVPWVLVLALAALSAVLVVVRWQVATPGSFTLNLGDPNTPASHFYKPEHSDTHAFRWSRALSAVSLPALATSQVVTITADAPRPEPDTRVHFRLLRGTSVLAEFDARPGWNSYSFPVTVGFYPDLRLIIESDTFLPGAGDDRRLGLAISDISAAPKGGRLGLYLPPLLLVVIALLLPILTFGAGRLHSRKLGLILATIAAPLTAVWSLVAQVWRVIPYAACGVGIFALALVLFAAYRWSSAGGWPTEWVRAVATSKWELPLLAIFHTVLAIVLTWPLVARIGTSLPSWPGDSFGFLYKLRWFRISILQTHQWPLFDPNSYAPYGFNLAQGEPTMMNTLPGVIIGSIFNDIVSYNVLVLASFVISGIGAYLLVRELTGSRAAGFLASVAFACTTYRFGQVGGHFQLLGTGWIPLAFYFIERAFKLPTIRNGVLAGLMVAFTALTAWYYGYMVGLMLVLYLAIRLWSVRREIPLRSLIRPAVSAAIVIVALVGPLTIPYIQEFGQGNLTHNAKAADDASASPTDYIIPNPFQPAWGGPSTRVEASRNFIDGPLYVGFVAGAIALFGWIGWRRRKERPPFVKVWQAWVALMLVAFVLSLGLTLHGLNGQVRVQGAGGTFPVPMPGQLLYDWLPLYSSMRAYSRFAVIVALSTAVLMGFGWVYLTKKGWARRHAQWLTLLALVLILADQWTSPYKWGSSRIEPTKASQFIASLPPGTVMQMPLDSTQQGPVLFAQTYYNKPVAYGYDTFEPPEWRPLRPALQSFPSDKAFDVLKEWGVRYLIVSANAYGRDWPGKEALLNSLPRLKHLQDFQERRIWDVDPAQLDDRPDMDEYTVPDTLAVYELVK